MEPFPLTSAAAWLAAGGFGFAGALWAVLWTVRRRRDAAPSAPSVVAPAANEPLIRRLELRMEALEGLQSALAARLDAPEPDQRSEPRLQGMAAQILGLVRDKDASLATALAGLDQLRARLRVLERLGDLAEARALLERLEERLEAVAVAEAATRAAAAARLAALEAAAPPFAAISDQLARLCAQKDATLETVFARLAPLEARLAELERARADEGAVARAEARTIAPQLAALRAAAEETRRFASRIGLLEASLPRLSTSQALMMEALERQAAADIATEPARDAAHDPDAAPPAPGEDPPAPGDATGEEGLSPPAQVVSARRI